MNIFTIDEEEVKVLLIKKQTDPYKGYWMIPKTLASNEQTVDQTAAEVLHKLSVKDTKLYQYHTISDLERVPGLNILNLSYVGFIDVVRVKISDDESPFEKEWFSVNKLPKMAYNHQLIVFDNLEFLKEKLKKASVLNLFFPSDFSLPELQRVYEKLYGIQIDRRNFRKKFINHDLIEETNLKNEDTRGRQSKLYML